MASNEEAIFSSVCAGYVRHAYSKPNNSTTRVHDRNKQTWNMINNYQMPDINQHDNVSLVLQNIVISVHSIMFKYICT